jgi:hypothetical protein
MPASVVVAGHAGGGMGGAAQAGDGPGVLTLAPRAGTVGTPVMVTGTVLPVGRTVSAFTTESAKGPQGHVRALGKRLVPADGRVQFRFTTTGYAPQREASDFRPHLVRPAPVDREAARACEASQPPAGDTPLSSAAQTGAAGPPERPVLAVCFIRARVRADHATRR